MRCPAIDMSYVMKRSLKLLSSMVGVLGLSAGLSLPAIAQQRGATPAQQVAPGDTPPADAGNQAPVVPTPAEAQQNPGSNTPSAPTDTVEGQPSVAPYSPQRQQNDSPNSQNQNQSGERNQTPETRNPAPAPNSQQQPGSFDNQNQSPANQTPGTRNPAPAPGSTQRQQNVTPGSQDPTQNGNNASPDTVEDQPSVAPFDQQRQRTGSPNPGNTAPSQRNQAPTDPTDTRRGASPDPIESLSADSQGMTIDEIVDKSDSFRLFNALLRVAAIEDADFAAKLAGDRNYTVFAPTDRAFLALPEGTITQLVKPENRALLVEILSNHVVEGRVAANQMPGMTASSSNQVQSNVPEAVGRAQPGATPNAPLSAVPGPISPEENMNRERSVSFSPSMGGNVQVIRPDIQASNGVIHVIDQVILPADIESRLVTSTSSSNR
jgi:uncharacterized surface protein with fasciclin (FAS1) repeats